VKSPGQLAELRTAARIGAQLTPASGALAGAKGDMHIDRLKVENKSTVGKAINIKAEWLVKIEGEAREVGMVPALAFQFTHADGRPRMTPYVCIPEWLFVELVDVYRKTQD